MFDIELLIKSGPCKKFLAGSKLPAPGGATGERVMYVLVSGRIDVYKSTSEKNVVPERSVIPGETFGGYEFFNDAASDESIYIAHSDSIVYIMSQSSFVQLAQTYPEILFEIMRAAYTPPGKAHAPQAHVIQKHGSEDRHAHSDEHRGEPSVQQPEHNDEHSDEPSAKHPVTAISLPAVELSSGSLFPDGHKSYPGITKPSYTKLLYKKDYVCPFCNKKFFDYKVLQSKLYQSKPVRYDLRKYYSDFQTEWYDVISCPYCYFSTFYSYYSEPRPFTKAKIEDLLTEARANVMLNFDDERDIDFVFTSHYLALLCAPGYMSNYRPLSAKLWGNISWLYEDVEDEEMMRFAALKTAEAYEAVYMETKLNPIQEQVTCLTIAGMLYRAGKEDNIRKYLFNAKTISQGNKAYSILAEDLMDMLHASAK